MRRKRTTSEEKTNNGVINLIIEFLFDIYKKFSVVNSKNYNE